MKERKGSTITESRHCKSCPAVADITKVAIVFNDDADTTVAGHQGSSSPQGVIDTAEKVAHALKSKGISSELIPLRSDVDAFLKAVKNADAEMIFNLCESALGSSIFEMHIAALLEIFDFRFTGSEPLALGMCLHKAKTKAILAYHGIPTAEFTVVDSPLDADRVKLRFPLMIKPVGEDASVGIDANAVVEDKDALQARIAYVVKSFCQPALVEEYIDGREFNIAILGNGDARALPVSEIDFSQLPGNVRKICSFDAKWMPESPMYKKTPPVCPAHITDSLRQKLSETALKAYHLLGCRDYARVDMRMGEDGIAKVLEVNPNPDISPDAGFARSAAADGFDYSAMILEIVKIAYTRYLPL